MFSSVKQQSPDKTPFEKTVLKSFEDNITSVSMDDRHVLVGLSNGKVGAVYYKEKFVKEKFVTDCSSVGITAVLADSFDVAGVQLFCLYEYFFNIFSTFSTNYSEL